MIDIKLLVEAVKKAAKGRLKRDAFLYLDPKGEKNQFAQCSTCRMWTGKDSNTCSILGKTKVTGDMSCGLYVYGKPSPSLAGKEVASYTPQEAGLVNREVRCENCRSYSNGICLLFQTLNKSNPDIFDLDEKVNKHGCCNAQMPKEND